VLHQNFQRREALLRMPRFVRLYAGKQVRETDVAALHCVGGERDELHVREPVFQGEVHAQRGIDAIGVQQPIVAEAANGDDTPLVGVKGLLAPVEARIVLQQIMREQQLELRVSDLVEHAEHSDVAPARARREARETA
jgi:hypothetical protein